MKKFRKILVALVFAFMAFVGLTGCGDDGDKIVGAQVVSGSIATTVAKGGTVDTSKMKAQIRYKEAETKTVDMSELEIVQAPDTSVVGETTMKVKYNGYEFTVTIKVVATEADVNSISLLESQLLIDYNANRAVQENKQDEFFVKNSPLYVGDDNAFNFRLNAAGRDGAGKPVLDIEKVRTNISIAKKDGSTFVALDDDDMETYIDAIDTENTTIDFSNEACGEVFQVLVEAANKDYSAEENATKFTAVLHVMDGYNVYNAADLSIYDNTNRDGIWNDKKAATGMTGKTTKAVILQDNIRVTKDDVPVGYFWNAATESQDSGYQIRLEKLQELEQTDEDLLDGTLKNDSGTGLYRRTVAHGETFTFEGNYFKVDLSSFPKCVAEGEYVEGGENKTKVVSKRTGEAITSYMTTFFNLVDDAANVNAPTSVDVKNVRFYGNGSLNNDVENSGSIILMKNHHVNLNAYNTIQHNYYIGYFFNLGVRDNPETTGVVEGQYTGDFVVDTCKGYYSYQDLFYGYAAENVVIRNGEFKHAGGPAVIAAYNGPVKESEKVEGEHYGSYFHIINTVLESEVVGTEAWFKNYNATSIVQQFSLLENLFSGATGAFPAEDKSIFTASSTETVKKLNMTGVIYNASMKGIESVYAEGAIRIFENEAEYQEFLANGENTNSTYGVDTNKNIYNSAKTNGSIYLEAEGNGGYINQNVDSNWDTSYFGMFQANAVAGIINADDFAALRTAMATYYQAEIPADFGAKTLDEQKSILTGYIDKLVLASQASDATLAGGAAQMIQAIYAYGSKLEGYDNPAIKKAVFNIDQLTILKDDMSGIDSAKLVTALKAQINAFENKSFAVGTHLNIYLHLGLCAMIGLTDVDRTPTQA